MCFHQRAVNKKQTNKRLFSLNTKSDKTASKIRQRAFHFLENSAGLQAQKPSLLKNSYLLSSPGLVHGLVPRYSKHGPQTYPAGNQGSWFYKTRSISFTVDVLSCASTQGPPGSEMASLLVKGLGRHHSLFFIVVRRHWQEAAVLSKTVDADQEYRKDSNAIQWSSGVLLPVTALSSLCTAWVEEKPEDAFCRSRVWELARVKASQGGSVKTLPRHSLPSQLKSEDKDGVAESGPGGKWKSFVLRDA